MLDKLRERETEGFSLCHYSIRKLTDVIFAITGATFLKAAGANKCSYSPARLHGSAAFQLCVDFGDSVGVDPQFDCQLPHSRQLLADSQLASGYGKPDRPSQLRIKRCWVRRVNEKCFSHSPIVLRT